MARLCVAFFVFDEKKESTCPAPNSTQQLLVSDGETSVLSRLKRRGYLARLPPHSLAQAAGANTTLGIRLTLLEMLADNLPTLQRQILVLLGRPVHVGQVPSDTAQCAWPFSCDADVGRDSREATFRGGTVHRSELEHKSSRLVSRRTA